MKISVKKSKRSKNIRITIRSCEDILLTYPWYISKKDALNFLESKKNWINKHLNNRDIIGKKKYTRDDYLRNKETARRFAEERLSHFSEVYKLCPKRIFIRNQKTRWGSCSSRKNLSFNWKIIKLPPHLADYIIVHELCHLSQMNHSKDFWKLVERTVPKYKEIRGQIRRKGYDLL